MIIIIITTGSHGKLGLLNSRKFYGAIFILFLSFFLATIIAIID